MTVNRLGRVVRKGKGLFRAINFKGKVFLVLIPALLAISFVFTIEAIVSQRTILRDELIKKGETIATIAAKHAELPILSENIELLEASERSLKEIADVSFVQFSKKEFEPLIREGEDQSTPPRRSVPPGLHVSVFEESGYFDIYMPVYTVKAKEDIDIFQESSEANSVREHIGWARIGLSKEVMNRAVHSVILRGAIMAILFTAVGSLLMYLLLTIATRPLNVLLQAVKGIRDGEYTEIPYVNSVDEIGRLSAEFNHMSAALKEREDRISSMIWIIQEQNRNLDELVKKRTSQLEKAYEELKQIDELKSSFLSTVSHELRTPLTAVLGFARITKTKFEGLISAHLGSVEGSTLKTVGQIRDNLEIIGSEGERLRGLINDVLDLAKLETGKIDWRCEPVALREVLERAVASMSILAEQKGIELQVGIESTLPSIMGDRDRLLQVVINLISNAVKFTDQGAITCQASRLQDELVVRVIDTGIGIAEADQHLVFEKFKQVGDTLTSRPEGTGLGLPICRQIVEHHGGRIWVESVAGQGSIFSFTLPVAAETGPVVVAGAVSE